MRYKRYSCNAMHLYNYLNISIILIMQQQFMEICVGAVFRRSIVCYVHDAADYNSRSRF